MHALLRTQGTENVEMLNYHHTYSPRNYSPTPTAAETAVGLNRNHLGCAGLQGGRESTKGKLMGHTPAGAAEPKTVPLLFKQAMLSDELILLVCIRPALTTRY